MFVVGLGVLIAADTTTTEYDKCE
ncbi:hypothetical protein HaLaN_15370 [Haematococcus lacustris]|uniref:Uncharacterized protein n=1 Tax=Haematococcus lacustris TaxID=44745 RepID=A0A699Z7D6_HAELA|nr:hypothetical protein HaLaN_15370 [Haematococcus lacustris]